MNQFVLSCKTKAAPETLLANDNELYNWLIKSYSPLSFEQVFGMELKEILLNRDRRVNEEQVAKPFNKNQATSKPLTRRW